MPQAAERRRSSFAFSRRIVAGQRACRIVHARNEARCHLDVREQDQANAVCLSRRPIQDSGVPRIAHDVADDPARRLDAFVWIS
jgi:hypothetical protein